MSMLLRNLRSRRAWRLHSVTVVVLVCLVIVAVVWPIAPTAASWWDGPKTVILGVLSWALYLMLISAMGTLATIATNVLVYTAQFNHFTDLPVIVEAWATVRDFANMFFIIILLVIAFGTLFRIEAYSWKKLLPSMILSAILINYSRAICGFIVDASQVITLTFVAAIKDAAAVGLSSAFQLDKLLQFENTYNSDTASTAADAANDYEVQRLLGIIAAGVMLSTLFMVQCVYIVIMVGRLVMIWFLTVLSPLAYATRVLPQTQKYSSQWWEMFGRYVTVGPLAMFFLWLAMFIAAKSIDAGGLGKAAGPELVSQKAQLASANGAGALDTTLLSGFIVATMMLLAGSKLAMDNASEIGAATSKAQGFGKWITRKPMLKGLSYLNDRQAMVTGYDLNIPRVFKNWQHGLETNKRWRENQIASTAGIRHREGNLLAGVLGAGDQVAETGVTLDQFRGLGVGTAIPLPFIGRLLNRAGLDISKEAAFRRALTKESATNATAVTAGKSRDDLRKGYENKLRTNTDFNREQAELDQSRDTANALGTAYATNPDMVFDTNKNAEHRSLVETRIGQLQETLSDSKVSDVQKQQNAEEISKLQQGLEQGSFKQSDLGVNLSSNVFDHVRAAAKAANDHAATRKDATNDGKFHTQADIGSFISEQTDVKAADAAAEAAKAEAHTAHEKRHKLGPRMGSAWELKFRAAVNEEGRKITTKDASELLDGFVDAVENHRGTEAAAWYEKLCETGNDNEPYKHYGLDFDASENGAQKLAKKIQEKTRLSQQAVLSTMHRGSQLSEAVGHTPVTQMFDLKSGEFVWRPLEVQIEYAKGEEAKKTQKRHQTDATRLRTGEMTSEYKPNEKPFMERTILNILKTSKANHKSETNTDYLKGLMRSPERWKVFQDETKRLLKPKDAKEALRRLREECREGGIAIAD